MKNYLKIKELDGLCVFSVPIADISDKDHSMDGKELENYYSFLTKEMINGQETPIVLYIKDNQLLICDGWHRWKVAQILKWETIEAVIFESINDCYPTENMPW